MPVYALVKKCIYREARLRASNNIVVRNKRVPKNEPSILTTLRDPGPTSRQQANGTNDLGVQIALRERIRQAGKTQKKWTDNRRLSGVARFSFRLHLRLPLNRPRALSLLSKIVEHSFGVKVFSRFPRSHVKSISGGVRVAIRQEQG